MLEKIVFFLDKKRKEIEERLESLMLILLLDLEIKINKIRLSRPIRRAMKPTRRLLA